MDWGRDCVQSVVVHDPFLFFFSSFSNPAHVVHCGINSCGLQSFTVQMASKKKKKEKNQIKKWRTSNMVWGKKCRARGFGSALTFSPQSQWPYLPAAQRLEPHQSQRLSFVSPHYPQFTLNYLPSWTAPLASFVAAPHNAKLLPVILKCSPLNCSLVTFHVVTEFWHLASTKPEVAVEQRHWHGKCKWRGDVLQVTAMDMIFSSIEGRGAPEERMWENWEGHALGGGCHWYGWRRAEEWWRVRIAQASGHSPPMSKVITH